MKAFIPKGWKRPILTSDNPRLKSWRQDVTKVALLHCKRPTSDPVRISARFFFQRPKSLKKTVLYKTTKPDADKLLRGILDSLTGIVYVDDSQVVSAGVAKEFGTPERVEIVIAFY
jgi:crossover junction endodeoxyribonuclease RusA